MACPGLNRGQVRVEHYDRNVTKFIAAHDGDLAELALSLDGRMLATASEKGTLVRVYDAREATLLHEFRRGADRATIYSIAFSPSKEYLACTSDKGTMHVYRIPEESSPPRRDPRGDGGGGGGGGGARRPRGFRFRRRRVRSRVGGALLGGWGLGPWLGPQLEREGSRRGGGFGGVFLREGSAAQVLQQRVELGAVQAAGVHARDRGVRVGAERAGDRDRGGDVLQGGVRPAGGGRVRAARVCEVHEIRARGGGDGVGRRRRADNVGDGA